MLRGLSFGAAALLLMVSTGCSDTAAPPAIGGAYIEVATASPAVTGKQCPGGGALTLGSIPPSTTDNGSPLTDDESGATVECSVGGGKFSGFLYKAPVSLRIKGQVDTATGTGTATLQVYDPNSLTTLVSEDGQPCTVTATDPMRIKDDTAWGQVVCPHMISESQPSVLCSVPTAVFYFSECN